MTAVALRTHRTSDISRDHLRSVNDVTDPEAVPYGEIADLPPLAQRGAAFEGVVAHPHVVYRSPPAWVVLASSVVTAVLVVTGLTFAARVQSSLGLRALLDEVAPRLGAAAASTASATAEGLAAVAAQVRGGRETQTERYVVQRGDTLAGISKRRWGDPALWKVLFEANRSVLRDPTDLKVGVELVIPEAPTAR